MIRAVYFAANVCLVLLLLTPSSSPVKPTMCIERCPFNCCLLNFIPQFGLALCIVNTVAFSLTPSAHIDRCTLCGCDRAYSLIRHFALRLHCWLAMLSTDVWVCVCQKSKPTRSQQRSLRALRTSSSNPTYYSLELCTFYSYSIRSQRCTSTISTLDEFQKSIQR